MLFICCFLVVCCSLRVVCCVLFGVRFSLFVVCHVLFLFVVCCLVFGGVSCLLRFVVWCWLCVVSRWLFVALVCDFLGVR